jgi:acyl dehydratase
MWDAAWLTLDRVKPGQALPELAVDVDATLVVLGALASRDWRPMHHDRDFAQKRNGVRDIFLNTPNLAAWYERYLTDWTGPTGRLGRMRFRMRDSIFPGDRMLLRGTVEKVEVDASGCGWAEVTVRVEVGERLCTECTARVALPTGPEDNPWARRGDAWKP